ncbi:RagB/SusD family nutrient uptake outer membrane protein [Paraflavitalea speifideaquila]|uniref:RagB/SusD family nutrient uptake outer membrane protein n=1 Tax=Paraflavitalea speifideaquila TaxID=3076558 RepID=UPI0028E7681A|nr:RagB/SusD family nutrient uptake outer membrane protein [Paraflavitalea speifideiaquila]
MRNAIRKERRIELAFESTRYFDTRRWKIAEQTDKGPMYGLNINADGTAFYNVVPFETRVFEKKHYLFPIPQGEIDVDKKLVQNTGWE